jgi:GNAT superfamily N-acetyltransferase
MMKQLLLLMYVIIFYSVHSYGLASIENQGLKQMVIGEKFRLRPLTTQDAQYVNSKWPYRSTKSLLKIRKQLQLDPKCCLGIENQENDVIACIMRYQNGALGMLHVDDEYRRCGLGSRLLREATHILEEESLPCFAYILDNNSASETLFTREGWVKEDPNVKKRTGRRRAKRKWIKA